MLAARQRQRADGGRVRVVAAGGAAVSAAAGGGGSGGGAAGRQVAAGEGAGTGMDPVDAQPMEGADVTARRQYIANSG